MRWSPQVKHPVRGTIQTFNCYVEAATREEAKEKWDALGFHLNCYEVEMVCILPNLPEENK